MVAIRRDTRSASATEGLAKTFPVIYIGNFVLSKDLMHPWIANNRRIRKSCEGECEEDPLPRLAFRKPYFISFGEVSENWEVLAWVLYPSLH